MPSTISDGPSVAMSFANNFWGPADAGVNPLLERMHGAKTTCDELKGFYTTRAAIEDEYARKLLALCRKPLGSQETGTLRASLDVVRGEVEQMGKSHQNIAAQMKTELDEPLAAFAGAMKERRKIVQGGIEKLHKTKIQQTQQVNKTRDRYEQECLKIKGYLAQGHMVMGQEERKNKAKLEKTQINLATSNSEYESAVKVLEETTGRWNRDWKAAADKFQDLEEERLDFMKSSLWSFANIASTVCVSDDASCEKIRLSLENCEVEKDIVNFIKTRGTGQEIPDPPRYIDFRRGDVSDTQSEASDDGTYSVAQFQRTINPAFRSSSPQPSTYESHHDPKSSLARELGHYEPDTPPSREATLTPQKALTDRTRQPQIDYRQEQSRLRYEESQHGPLATVPHDPYPMDGMTMLCRTGPPSEKSSAHSSARPSSRDDGSEYSNPTSFSSFDPASGKQSPIKQDIILAPVEEKQIQKKKSGFFQSHSPFRRKSTREKDHSSATTPSARNNTWSSQRPSTSASTNNPSPTRQNIHSPSSYGQGNMLTDRPRGTSPEPVDPRASFQLNIGNNVFDVETPDRKNRAAPPDSQALEDLDPIAQALAELKGATKQSSKRISADKYHGIATPVPGAGVNGTNSSPARPLNNVNAAALAGMRGTPPPSYDTPSTIQRLGAPQPAFTAKAMNATREKYASKTQNMFSPPSGSPSSQQGQQQYQQRAGSQAGSYGGGSMSRNGNGMPRATSPSPLRSISPRPGGSERDYRSASPNPYGGSQQRGQSQQTHGYNNGHNSTSRAVSPAPYRDERGGNGMNGMNGGGSRHGSMNAENMSMQLSGNGEDWHGSQRSRNGGGGGNMRPGTSGGGGNGRPQSSYGGNNMGGGMGKGMGGPERMRSKSVADGRGQFTREGRAILHFSRAMYMYQAAIPEELSFAKGDVLAVLRLQDDGWWEAEHVNGQMAGRGGLVPSNYLNNC